MTDPTLRIIEREARERWSTEKWYRRNRWATWTDLRTENKVILRELLSIRRMARAVHRAELDPMTEAKRYESWLRDELPHRHGESLSDWAPGELVEAWGR